MTGQLPRPVAELDATADRCLMMPLDGSPTCLNGHAIGDVACKATSCRNQATGAASEPTLFDAEAAS